MSVEKIREAIIDPGWEVRRMEMDGSIFTVLRLEHPRFGRLDFLLPSAEAIAIAAALDRARVPTPAKLRG